MQKLLIKEEIQRVHQSKIKLCERILSKDEAV